MNLLAEQIIEIKKYCIEKAPKEACGYIHEGKVYFCENKATTNNTFELSEKDSFKIQQLKGAVLWHSHTDGMNYPSKQDMEMQQETNVPWLIFVLKKVSTEYTLQEYFEFGANMENVPLYERNYKFGVTDCASFIVDYFKEKGIMIPYYPRDMKEWMDGAYSYEETLKKSGFKEAGISLSDIKEGDILLFNIRAKFPNHAGVYLGNGIFGHHLQDRLSKKEPVEPWSKYFVKALRYAG